MPSACCPAQRVCRSGAGLLVGFDWLTEIVYAEEWTADNSRPEMSEARKRYKRRRASRINDHARIANHGQQSCTSLPRVASTQFT